MEGAGGRGGNTGGGAGVLEPEVFSPFEDPAEFAACFALALLREGRRGTLRIRTLHGNLET